MNAQTPAAGCPAPNHRILVVDDNPAIHDDIRKILAADSGQDPEMALDEIALFNTPTELTVPFEIDSAYQGQEGLAALERSVSEGNPYAMAFVDVRMPPGWDGVETIQRMWLVHPSLQVVVCTAYSDYSWADIRRKLGESDSLLILKKPFDNIEVVQLAHTLTRKWQVSREASLRLDELEQMVSDRTGEFRKAQQAFQAIFEASPIGIMLSDMQVRCIRANAACERITGLPAGELAGKDPVELGWIPDYPVLEEMSRTLASFGSVDAKEVPYSNPGFGNRTGLVWLREVTINHEPHILTFFVDITNRKEMEEELRRARAAAESSVRVKAEFLANMSHEIRTPLNGLLGLSALLEEKTLAADSRSLLRLIRATGETLAKILNDVLDYSKIESGKLELEQASFSVRECVDWAIELFRPRADEKHLTLDSAVAPDVPPQVIGDATRIRQVLANLISNAIKFTEQGSVKVHAEMASAPAAQQRQRPYVRIRVHDTGIGIEPAKAELLFQSFRQLDPSTSRRYGGTGLGLVICRRLIEMMGGRIGVSSLPGEGSTFEFEFPAGVPQPSETAKPARTAPAGGGPLGLKILIAEDNRVNQLVVEGLLRKLGCSVDLVGDGGLAVERVCEQFYDVLLMDVQMPVVDGLEAARRIRRIDGERGRIPIVAMTASATLENRQDCLTAGMDDYITKPLTLDALRQALERWAIAAGSGGEEPAEEHVVKT